MYVKRKLNRIVGVCQWIILNVLQKHWVQTTVLHVESDDKINRYYGETVLVTTLEGEIDSDAYSTYKIIARTIIIKIIAQDKHWSISNEKQKALQHWLRISHF